MFSMAKRVRSDSVPVLEDEGAAASSRSTSVEPAAHTPKYAELDQPQPAALTMRCFLPPHKPMSFGSYADYETHYSQVHGNRCEECKKNLPTAHFLDLHIAENHDPIVAGKRDAGEKTYSCFVEGCDKVCNDWKKRRSHLVDKHGFPKNYDFFIVNDGVDGKRSMLRRGIDAQGHRKSSRERRPSFSTEITQSTEATSVSPVTSNDSELALANTATASTKPTATSNTEAMDDITNSMSAMKMVPRSITFGKRKGRSGFAKS